MFLRDRKQVSSNPNPPVLTFKGDVHLSDAKAPQTAADGPASGGLGLSGNEIAAHASGVLLLAGTSTLGSARKAW